MRYFWNVLLLLSMIFLPAASVIAQDNPEIPYPTLRIPKMNSRPTIDGTLAAREWQQAAMITGFVDVMQGNALLPSELQTTIFLGYDTRYLYLGMRSLHPKGSYPRSTIWHDQDMRIYGNDNIVWQLCKYDRANARTPGYGFYHFVINPAGAVLSQFYDGKITSDGWSNSAAWSIATITGSQVTATAWTLEMAIPLYALGATPLDGQQWVMQLQRTSAWATPFASAWGGNDWKTAPLVIFDPQTPAVQAPELGNLLAGDFRLPLKITASSQRRHTVSVRAMLQDEKGAMLYSTDQQRVIPASKSHLFPLQQRNLPVSETGNRLRLEVHEHDTLLYQHELLFTQYLKQHDQLVKNWRSVLSAQPTDIPSLSTQAPGWLRVEYERQKRLPVLFRISDEFLARNDGEEAERIVKQLRDWMPYLPDVHLKLAEVLGKRGKKHDALSALRAAVSKGCNSEVFADTTRWGSLSDDPHFAKFRIRAATQPRFMPRQPQPVPVQDRTAWVGDQNTRYDPITKTAHSLFIADTEALRHYPVTEMKDGVGDLLRQWFAEGTAAGNVGDFYDNRDEDHSTLERPLFPQLVFIEYRGEAASLGLNYWLAERITHEGIVLGNASLARTTGPLWRSIARTAYHQPESMKRLYTEYSTNKLYVYPAHQDHSPGRNGKLGDKAGGYGDVFAVNTPYLIISQGSSGSDQPFVRAVAATLAAFRPDVKALLADHGMLMPTVQMILRRSNTMITTPGDYLTDMAHPTVFDAKQLDIRKMIEMAHAITRECLPPLVTLHVASEDNPGQEANETHESEVLVDTPGAIARIWRGTGYFRRMVVSAEGSRDLSGFPLTYYWKVLRGDPQLIQFKPVNETGSRIEITVAYHPRRPINLGSALESNRVDIGVFVHNGTHYSAPAFISFFTLDNEERTYNAEGQILSVSYRSATDGGNYVDPVLATP